MVRVRVVPRKRKIAQKAAFFSSSSGHFAICNFGNWTALHKVEPQYNPVFDCRRIFAFFDEKPLAGLFPIIRLRLITSMYRIQEMPRKLGR